MHRFHGASPPRPAAQSLGWLPPRLLRAVRAAGHLFCLLFALPSPAFAQPQPVAVYEADALSRRAGDTFHVNLTVHWEGPADALDIPAPRPAPTDGLTFRMLGSESRHEGSTSHVRFRWQVNAHEPDTFAIDELLPVVAYSAESAAPLNVPARAPLRIHVHPKPSASRLALMGAGGVAAAAALGMAGAVIMRRRARARATRASIVQRRTQAEEAHAALGDALRLRAEGDYAGYLHALLGIVGPAPAHPDVATELHALRERVAFASYQPAEHELERAAGVVRRLLADRFPPTDEEIA